MANTALVTGADRGLGRALVEALLERGWTVLAGQHLDWPELGALEEKFPDHLHILPLDVGNDESVQAAAKTAKGHCIDLLISNAAINRSHRVNSIREPLDFADMQAELNVNAIGALRLVNAFLPLMESSELKRLCFVSSEAGSIGASYRTGWFGYCMSKAALNMAVKNMHNDLAKDGYSFRLYQPGYMKTYMSGAKNEEAHMEPEEAAQIALEYFLSPVVGDLALHAHSGEDMPW